MDVIQQINSFEPKSENCAAIYARKSMKNENNSLEAQRELGLKILKSNNLLLYKAYEDNISARKISAYERKGFNQLISDARAGYFKTVIAYRHDRLSRDMNDWIKIKNEFKSLGIKIIFTDENEFQANDSSISNFIENLLIMIAELEPSQTLQRASIGRDIRRQQGVYNPANYGLFGYDKLSKNIEQYLPKDIDKSIKVPSFYKMNYLSSFFVIYIFTIYNDSTLSGDKNERISVINEKIRHLEDTLIKIDEKVLKEIQKLKKHERKEKLEKLKEDAKLTALNDIIQKTEIDTNIVVDKLTFNNIDKIDKNNKVEKLFREVLYISYKQAFTSNKLSVDNFKTEVNKVFNHLKKTSNVYSIVQNPRYCGLQLKKAKEKQESFIYDDTEDTYSVEFKYYNRVINIDPIIRKEDWEKAVCHFLKYTANESREQKYLFKGLLKCDKCKRKLYLYENKIFKCTEGCTSIEKSTLIKMILNKLIDKTFSEERFTPYLKNQSELLSNQIMKLESEIKSLELTKRDLICLFLKKHSKDIASKINEKCQEINTKKSELQIAQLDVQNLSNLNKNIFSLYRDKEQFLKAKGKIINKLLYETTINQNNDKNELKHENEFKVEMQNKLLSLISEVIIKDDSTSGKHSFSCNVTLKSRK